QGTLEHWHYDVFQASWGGPMEGKALIQFVLGGDGKVAEAKVQGIADFARRPEVADTTSTIRLDAAALRRFVATYRAQGVPLEIEVQIVGDQLRLTVPGQPAYTLVAESPTRFRLTLPGGQMPAGFFVEFALDADRVREMALIQPAPQPTLKLQPVPR
ncbi:MAG TPA: hypothetical protein VGA42_07195, partial [Gemmatimonadales bacterium]